MRTSRVARGASPERKIQHETVAVMKTLKLTLVILWSTPALAYLGHNHLFCSFRMLYNTSITTEHICDLIILFVYTFFVLNLTEPSQ